MRQVNTNVKDRLKALGFNNSKVIGLNALKMEAGDTRIVKITSTFNEFTKKDGKVLKYIDVVDLESGEEGILWAGGQLVYQLKQLKDGFAGGSFAIEYKGLVDVDGEDMHQYSVIAVN